MKAIAKTPSHFRFRILDFNLFTERDFDGIFLTAFSAIQNPNSQIQNSLDDPVRPCQHVLWDCHADLFRRFQIDDQLELIWLFHGKVGRLGAFQDSVHVCGYAPVAIRNIGNRTDFIRDARVI